MHQVLGPVLACLKGPAAPPYPRKLKSWCGCYFTPNSARPLNRFFCSRKPPGIWWPAHFVRQQKTVDQHKKSNPSFPMKPPADSAASRHPWGPARRTDRATALGALKQRERRLWGPVVGMRSRPGRGPCHPSALLPPARTLGSSRPSW